MSTPDTKYLDTFEATVHDALVQHLLAQGRIDARRPDMPDIEERWQAIAQSYLPDGVREFAAYPTVSLGWMMYVGMALAQMWDEDWQKHSAVDDLYIPLRDKRGYDCMDEHIREDILHLSGDDYTTAEKFVGDCAQLAHHHLMREHLEPGTPLAFHAYVRCLHQLYLLGAASRLFDLGYRMVKA